MGYRYEICEQGVEKKGSVKVKVVAMLGGLGSQMFKHAFYLALREKSEQDCLIDTAPFDVMEMWNGYELERIFGIQEPDIKEQFSETDWERLKSIQGYDRNCVLDVLARQDKAVYYYNRGLPVRYSNHGGLSRIVYRLAMFLAFKKIEKGNCDYYPKEYASQNGSAYFDEFDHRSDEYFREYRQLVKEAFSFPEFEDELNRETAERMQQGNSVALHVRRGDHMYDNGDLFQRGYYKKSVGYIKENTSEKQTFYLFSDDLEWCLENLETLGLEEADQIIPVNWNHGENSFRDMQLMTYCQHNIIPISSFSWWGYYLSDNHDKIVCAPEGYWLEVEHHF